MYVVVRIYNCLSVVYQNRYACLLERLSNVSPVSLLGSRTVGDGLVCLTVVALRRLVSSWGLLLTLSESRLTVDTHKLTRVTFAILKAALLELSSVSVEVGTHHIVDMRGPFVCVRTVSCTEAELVGAHKVVPFLDLDPLTFFAGYVVAEHKTTLGVSGTVSAVRVELSTVVFTLDVEAGEIADASNLEEVGCLEELNTLNGSVGDQTSSVAGFETVRDNGLFIGSDLRVGVDGSPQAEVVGVVDKDVLAERLLRGGTPFLALVRTGLVGFPLVGEIVDVEVGLVLGKSGAGEKGSDGCEGEEGAGHN